jgi:hypothetical protein
MRETTERPTVPVGIRVRVPFPWHKMDAEVIEHRGFIGVDGREMVRVQPLDPSDDRGAFDVPVDEIEIVGALSGEEKAPPLPPTRRGRAA